MLISEIITEIILEVGGDSTDTTLSANLLSFCKSSLRRIPKRVRDRSLIKIGTVTLSAAAQTASVPTDFLKERGPGSVWRLVDGKRKQIDKVHFERFNIYHYSSAGSGPPNKYRIYGRIFEFDNKADQEYTIYCEYFKALMTGGLTTADTFALDENAIEPYKDMVKAYYYGYEDDTERESSNFNRALAYFSEIDDEFIEEEMGDHIEITE